MVWRTHWGNGPNSRLTAADASALTPRFSSKSHSDESRLGSLLSRRIDRTIGNRRLPDSDLLTRLQAFQVAQPGVSDVWARDLELDHRRFVRPSSEARSASKVGPEGSSNRLTV